MAPEPGVGHARLDADSPERFVPLRSELGVSSFGINQMILQPGQRGRIHRHERQEEVYLVLEGELTVAIEGEERSLRNGELLRVGPELKRQLINRSGGRVVVLALGGAGEHRGRDGEAFTGWDQSEGAPPQEVPLPEDLPAG
ncbi:MAG TPA: cupin domain-containing protein [Solirubrobacterales bacterium]|nr:cupin domain-containing protein [Solirubrobacterales bacterium]